MKPKLMRNSHSMSTMSRSKQKLGAASKTSTNFNEYRYFTNRSIQEYRKSANIKPKKPIEAFKLEEYPQVVMKPQDRHRITMQIIDKNKKQRAGRVRQQQIKILEEAEEKKEAIKQNNRLKFEEVKLDYKIKQMKELNRKNYLENNSWKISKTKRPLRIKSPKPVYKLPENKGINIESEVYHQSCDNFDEDNSKLTHQRSTFTRKRNPSLGSFDFRKTQSGSLSQNNLRSGKNSIFGSFLGEAFGTKSQISRSQNFRITSTDVQETSKYKEKHELLQKIGEINSRKNKSHANLFKKVKNYKSPFVSKNKPYAIYMKKKGRHLKPGQVGDLSCWINIYLSNKYQKSGRVNQIRNANDSRKRSIKNKTRLQLK